jgi:hypothetical protein
VAVNTCVGFPLIAPVDVLKLNPGGTDVGVPLELLKLYTNGATPPTP